MEFSEQILKICYHMVCIEDLAHHRFFSEVEASIAPYQAQNKSAFRCSKEPMKVVRRCHAWGIGLLLAIPMPPVGLYAPEDCANHS